MGSFLVSAAQTGRCEDIKTLVNWKADIEFKDEYDRTPLHCAIIWERENAFNLLIFLGANVNAQNKSGWTPLIEAISTEDPVRTNFVRSLLKANADPNVKNKYGKDAFDWANRYGWREEFNALIAEILSS